MELTFIDQLNRKIRLTRERMRYIGNHMSLNDKIHLIEEVIKNPEIVTEDQENNKIYYQKYIKLEALYLIIAIKISHNEGFIITIFKSKKQKM